MSLLAHMMTGLGPIELHHHDGQFETRRAYEDVVTGEVRVSAVPVFEANAREWYELAGREGATHLPFPQPVAATSERTPS